MSTTQNTTMKSPLNTTNEVLSPSNLLPSSSQQHRKIKVQASDNNEPYMSTEQTKSELDSQLFSSYHPYQRHHPLSLLSQTEVCPSIRCQAGNEQNNFTQTGMDIHGRTTFHNSTNIAVSNKTNQQVESVDSGSPGKTQSPSDESQSLKTRLCPSSVTLRTTRSPSKGSQSLKRHLFPRLVALRVVFPEWDDHQQSGRWHSDFILSRANSDHLEDYRAVLSVVPISHLESSASFTDPLSISNSDKRMAICALQGLDALRLDIDPEFRPLSHAELLSSFYIPSSSNLHPNRRPSCQHHPHPCKTGDKQSPLTVSSNTLVGRRHPQAIHTESSSSFNDDFIDEHHPDMMQRPAPTEDYYPYLIDEYQSRQQAHYHQNSSSLNESDNDTDDQTHSHDTLSVDPFFPYRKKFHVFNSLRDRTEWSVYLRREDRHNSRQFFLLQLLEKNTGDEYVFYSRWGRDEEDGNTNFKKVESLKDGRRIFEETFEMKTGNRWQGSVLKTLPRFIPVKGKYILHDDLTNHVSLALPLRGIIQGNRKR